GPAPANAPRSGPRTAGFRNEIAIRDGRTRKRKRSRLELTGVTGDEVFHRIDGGRRTGSGGSGRAGTGSGAGRGTSPVLHAGVRRGRSRPSRRLWRPLCGDAFRGARAALWSGLSQRPDAVAAD